MTKDDVLKYPLIKETIPLVKSFLQTDLTSFDYAEVFLHLVKIYSSLGMHRELIKETKLILGHLSDIIGYPKSDIISYLIKSLLAKKQIKDAFKYFEFLKLSLGKDELYKGIIFEIELNKLIGKPYKHLFHEAIKYNLPQPLKIDILKEKLLDELETKKYQPASETLKELVDLTHDDFPFETLQIYYKMGEEELLEETAHSFVKRGVYLYYGYLFLLKLYINQKKYHKAFTCEAEINGLLSNLSDNEKLDFYQECFRLYSLNKNTFLKKQYEKKVNEVKNILERHAKEIEQKISTIKAKQTNTLFDNANLEEVDDFSIDIDTENKNIEQIIDITKFAANIPLNLELREYFRTLFIFCDSYLPCFEHQIFFEPDNLFFYKKERLYDKKIISDNLDNTIVEDVRRTNRPKRIQLQDHRYSNPSNQEPLREEIKFILAYPLGDIGVYTVYIEDERQFFEHEKVFQFLATLIYQKLLASVKNNEMLNENKFLNTIINSQLFAMRILNNTKCLLNSSAKELLDLPGDVFLEGFYQKLKPDYVFQYKQALTHLQTNFETVVSLNYEYDNKNINEKMMAINLDGQTQIVSYFQDVTSSIKKMSQLEVKSNYDREVSLFNLSYLYENFDQYLIGKKTFILIELSLAHKDIYQFDVTKQFIKEFAKFINEYFTDGDCFRISYNEFLVIISQNDKRTIKQVIEKFNHSLLTYTPSSNPYEQFKTTIGYVRYPIVTDSKNADRIIRFLTIAKSLASRETDTNYHDFVFEDYEDDLFEQKVINYLNEALEQKHFSLVFHPIVNLEKKETVFYEVSINLKQLNIESDYLFKIAKKRNRVKDLEYEIIRQLFEFLKEFCSLVGKPLKVTIPLTDTTFFNPDFIDFFVSNIEHFNINPNYLRIKIKGNSITTSEYQEFFTTLQDMGVEIDTTNLLLFEKYNFNGLHQPLGILLPRRQRLFLMLENYTAKSNAIFIVDKINKTDFIKDLQLMNIKYGCGKVFGYLNKNELLEKFVHLQEKEENNVDSSF